MEMGTSSLGEGKSGILSTLRSEKPLFLLSILAALVYAFLSCLRHWRFATGGWDLGIHDQVIWEYSKLKVPASTLMGFSNALGDHFNPILALLAPFYWIFPAPELLFFAQSIAVALSVIAVFLFTQRRLGRSPAYLWSVAYAVFWGIQNALGYDFHDVLLAVPLIAFAIEYMDEREWRKVFICLALLLTVKEDMGLLVAAFGVTLMISRQWKKGISCAGIGLAAFFFEISYLIPSLAQPRGYTHWIYTDFGKTPWEALGTIVHHPFLVFQVWVSNSEKFLTMLWSFAACLFMIFMSPLLILALPIFAERMLSNSEHLWSMGYHYSATIAPILMMGGVDGLYRLAKKYRERPSYRKVVLTVSWVVLSLNLPTIFIFPLRDLFRVKCYRQTPVIKTGHQILSMIPPNALVLAQDTIVPHLSHRPNIYMIDVNTLGMDCDYFVACKALPSWPLEGFEPIEKNIGQKLEKGYLKVFEGDGWTVLMRRKTS